MDGDIYMKKSATAKPRKIKQLWNLAEEREKEAAQDEDLFSGEHVEL